MNVYSTKVMDVPRTQQQILWEKFCRKSVLNEEIAANKYYKQIKYMSKSPGMMLNRFILLKNLACG